MGANDVLEVLVWGLTGWKQGTATISGSSITALNNNGTRPLVETLVSMTVNAGDCW